MYHSIGIHPQQTFIIISFIYLLFNDSLYVFAQNIYWVVFIYSESSTKGHGNYHRLWSAWILMRVERKYLIKINVDVDK